MQTIGTRPVPSDLKRAFAVAIFASAFVAACSSQGGKLVDAGSDGRVDAADAPDGGSEPIADAQQVETDADGAVGGDALSTDARGDAGDASRDGASGDGGGDAGSVDAGQAPPCPTCRLYAVFTPLGQATQQVGPGILRVTNIFGITLVNGSNARASIDKVEVRYWFTANGVTALNTGCGGNCGRLAAAVLHPVSPRPGADNYLALTFQSGVLDAFSDTGLIQLALDAEANIFIGTLPLTLDDDYSFADPTQPDPKITIYDNGKLVWGTEPM